MSGGEPSSIKRHTRCAVGAPAPSERFGNRAGTKFDFLVYGLILITYGGVCMHQALYRKYRPLIFDDVIGQEHIVETVKNQIIYELVNTTPFSKK